MCKHSFYILPERIEFTINTPDGPRRRSGHPAFIPALPDFEFYYHKEQGGHVITEQRGGTIFRQSKSTKRLQTEVAEVIEKWGVDMISAQLQVVHPVAA